MPAVGRRGFKPDMSHPMAPKKETKAEEQKDINQILTAN
jgi:hypothetical protein